MDIDSLFKVPKQPLGGNKRKMPASPTPEMLKRMKVEAQVSTTSREPASQQSKSKPPAATVVDANDEDENMDFAPGGDADYFQEEDEDGRFFGGGLTEEQKQILNIFDSSGGEGVRDDYEDLSITSIRKMLLRFERAVNKNQDQRSKYPDDPTKFIDSEADLDAAIKALLPLAQAPALSFPELVRSGTVTLLVGLLSHENVDIGIDVVEVVHEFTDEDVGAEGVEEEDQESGQREKALKLLMEALLENQILELLVQNLGRLKESEESDKQGVFHILGVFENILGFDTSIANRLVKSTTILPWLLERITWKTFDENKGYAAELLSILLQGNQENRLQFGKEDGVEICLKVVSQYRKRDPKDADETEFMENVFDALCSALGEAEIKRLFQESEGVDLMVLLMKEKMQSRSRSIKVLDYALSGQGGTANCEVFVEALGLKTLFSAFMNKQAKKQKTNASSPPSEDTAHILGVISSLFTNIPSDSPARIRLLTKFVENEYEKVDKLLEVRENAETRLRITENEIEQEKKALLTDGEEIGLDEEDTWYLRKLEGGLFTLQTVDYILAWVCMEDDGIRGHTQLLLGRKNKSLQEIVKVLKLYHDNVGEDPIASDAEIPSQKVILEGLITFLEGY